MSEAPVTLTVQTAIHFLSDELIEDMFAFWARPLPAWYRPREKTWAEREREAIYHRTLRYRWWLVRYQLRLRTEPLRRAIAHRIYAFREDDD